MSELSERFWDEQAEWSQATFGTDQERGPIGPLKHLAKEVQEALAEIEQNGDHADIVMELADCQFLIFDAARRYGITHGTLFATCFSKLEINKKREWNVSVKDQPCEHVPAPTQGAGSER